MKRILLLIACILSLGIAKGQDTLMVDTLKWERRVYEKDIYRIVVSGYNPQVDTVEIYIGGSSETRYVIAERKRKKRRR